MNETRCPRCDSEDRPVRRYIDLGYQKVQCDASWHREAMPNPPINQGEEERVQTITVEMPRTVAEMMLFQLRLVVRRMDSSATPGLDRPMAESAREVMEWLDRALYPEDFEP
jgi:hypothetical protein